MSAMSLLFLANIQMRKYIYFTPKEFIVISETAYHPYIRNYCNLMFIHNIFNEIKDTKACD